MQFTIRYVYDILFVYHLYASRINKFKISIYFLSLSKSITKLKKFQGHKLFIVCLFTYSCLFYVYVGFYVFITKVLIPVRFLALTLWFNSQLFVCGSFLHGLVFGLLLFFFYFFSNVHFTEIPTFCHSLFWYCCYFFLS